MTPGTPSAILAITGATGAVGGLVARELSEAGLPLVLPARDQAKAPELPDAVVRLADYADRKLCEDALEGVETLFMVSGRENEKRLTEHFAFIDAAAAAGVRHVVYTSFMGAAPDATFTLAREHFHTEARIRASGMEWTFLRDCLYADYLEYFGGREGVIRGPAGEGRLAAVAQADVARCAAAVLREPDAHVGATYTLTGPQALTLTEVAEVIGRVRGREFSFLNETVEEAYESRKRWQADQWQYDAWVSTYTAIAAGEMAQVSDDVERLTGRRAMTLAEVLEGR